MFGITNLTSPNLGRGPFQSLCVVTSFRGADSNKPVAVALGKKGVEKFPFLSTSMGTSLRPVWHLVDLKGWGKTFLTQIRGSP